MKHILLIGSMLMVCTFSGAEGQDWKPVAGRPMTRWAAQIQVDNVLPEYPRPQMQRPRWMNLNGLWQFAIRPQDDQGKPDQWDGSILVPFAVESALSGVGRTVGPQQRLWYRRTWQVPAEWRSDGQRVLLHFEACDWQTTVWVNGRKLGEHRGGYDPFSFDVTDALADAGEQEIIISAWDPTDSQWQPRGKQVQKPHGIYYTAVTGLWGTVWAEPVPTAHIESLKITPDVDAGQVSIEARCTGGAQLQVEVLDGDGQTIAQAHAAPDATLTLPITNARLWSPDDPYLYNLKVTLAGDAGAADELTSYFGMRKIALQRDDAGVLRLALNNNILFQFGPLDQGWWPDGLYTAPSDEALRYDIDITKQLGFNMIRKHVKVEPRRWYTWCDRIGMLVWQDMPSGDRGIKRDQPDIVRGADSAANYEREYQAMIDTLYNHPCIVMWVPFNEGWGQFDTARIVQWTKDYDPTRLVNNTSGWADRGVGDVNDMHKYPGPGMPEPEEKRAVVLGEFGGLGLPLAGHTWQDEKNWGYRSYENLESLQAAILDLLAKTPPLIQLGLSAAVYTQTTDVEIEVNGLMTYDRAVLKVDPQTFSAAVRKLYD